MPLIKHIKLGQSVKSVDKARLNELIANDVIRHIAGGIECSVRTLNISDKSSRIAAYQALDQLAEPGVQVGQEILNVHSDAQRLLADNLTELFWKAGIGVAPSKDTGKVVTAYLGHPSMRVSAESTAHLTVDETLYWYPVEAVVVGFEIVILFRLLQSSANESEVTKTNSWVCGMAMKDVSYYFGELSSMIAHINKRASEEASVKESFEELVRLLRPREVAEKRERERLARYSEVQSFGMWG